MAVPLGGFAPHSSLTPPPHLQGGGGREHERPQEREFKVQHLKLDICVFIYSIVSIWSEI